MKVRVGDTVRFPLPSVYQFVPYAPPSMPPQRWLMFTVTPALLRAVLATRKKRRPRRAR